MSGMVEGHVRNATGLKPWALAQGVGSFRYDDKKENVSMYLIFEEV